MENSHAKSVDEVLAYFEVDEEHGLSDDQVKRQHEKYGFNELPVEERKFQSTPVQASPLRPIQRPRQLKPKPRIKANSFTLYLRLAVIS